MEPESIRQLFLKFLEGRCARDEVETLISYLRDTDSRQAFPGVEEVRRLIEEEKKLDAVSAERIFTRITRPARKNLRFSRIGIAASVTILLGIFLGIYLMIRPGTVTYATGYGEKRTVTLEDGSSVTLNANTVLKVKKNLGKASMRETWLEGEAFFAVASQGSRRFVVHGRDGMRITVLGTEFNVKARREEARVVLNKGRVKVNTQDREGGEEMHLTPGEMATLDPESGRLSKSLTDTLYHAAWRYYLLEFRAENLEEVGKRIREQYGYEVVLEQDSLSSLQFTGSVPADDLKLALQMLAETFGLQVHTEGRKIYISE